MLAGLVVLACLVPGFALAGSTLSGLEPLRALEPPDRHFDRYEIGAKVVYFHQRMIDGAIVEGDYVNYQFDAASGALLAKKVRWRDDLPGQLPQIAVSREEAEALAGVTVGSAKLYVISPESKVFPIRPVPQNPCWVVRSTEDGQARVTVIDAVTGQVLGPGVSPPYTAFSFTGPWECPGEGDWHWWSENAASWYNIMGYGTEVVISPTLEKIRSHVKSDETAMFYEIAHGGSTSFNHACDSGSWLSLPAFKIGVWIGAYAKMPFAFIASCDGMCELGNDTFSYEFRKNSVENTVTVGYCGMSTPACGECWSWSWDWQNALFGYMNQGWTVKAAFDEANADYPMCWSNSCMRFAGDEALAVVPVVMRDPELPLVTVIAPDGGEVIECGTQYEIRWGAEDNARVTSVTILLSMDGGASFPDTIAAGEANDSSYIWTVPRSITETARIRVVAYDGVPNEGSDVSNADFTLVDDTAAVGHPQYVGAPAAPIVTVKGGNPASTSTRIVYGVPSGSEVVLSVYDVAGRIVSKITGGYREAGYYQVDWAGATDPVRPVSPGIYFLRLDCAQGGATAKIVVAR
jgi:hypothetical protein